MILVIDNYDSFTFNIVQYLGQCGANVQVLRNDQTTVEEIVTMCPSGILISPGPGGPCDAKVGLEVLQSGHRFFTDLPIFGVCLGCQAMGLVAGAEVRKAKEPRHGKVSPIQHDGRGCFEGLPSPLKVTRYHSLVVDQANLSLDYEVTATALDDLEVMAIRHKTRPIEGVQFHPESILTEHGLQILRNFADRCQPRS